MLPKAPKVATVGFGVSDCGHPIPLDLSSLIAADEADIRAAMTVLATLPTLDAAFVFVSKEGDGDA